MVVQKEKCRLDSFYTGSRIVADTTILQVRKNGVYGLLVLGRDVARGGQHLKAANQIMSNDFSISGMSGQSGCLDHSCKGIQ